MENSYRGKKIEFHILQSFPVTCLNRDDVGAPKTAIVGGVTRARVSSQAWKRQVRLALQDFGIKIGVRTKHVGDIIAAECLKLGADEQQAETAGNNIAEALTKNTLHFFTETEAAALAVYAKEKGFEVDSKDKELIKIHKKHFNPAVDGLDIALFGRMVAQANELKVEAASSFAHAISTHKISNEVEFFTALDDAKPEESEDAGSSHMGTLEFNSATYYRYVSLDVGQLVEILGGDEQLDSALSAFTKALYVAVPGARQTTQAGYIPWDYARVLVRKGQRIQASFDEPVKAKGEGYVKPSIERLNRYIDSKAKQSGSLFGKISDLAWGIDDDYSIDSLIDDLITVVKA
jgi:CRISPR system Cascade subunit CasC